MTPLQKFIKDFKNKKVLIMGLGILGKGVADAKFFASIGAQVTVTDLKPAKLLQPSLNKLKHLAIKFVLEEHRKEDFLNADLIIRNPDVPWNSLYLQLARKNKKRIFMDETLFLQYANVNVIGITGTRGKSTSSALIFEILKKAKYRVFLAGNVKGTAVLPLLRTIKNNDWLVLELSSWQLQGFADIKKSPHISVLTNIYEDHLNRYPSMAAYTSDKKNIFLFQNDKDYLVINKSISCFKRDLSKAKGKIITFSREDIIPKLSNKTILKGNHNLENMAAAFKVAEILKIENSLSIKAVSNFPGLAYRQEKVRVVKGITYINDTTSTTPVAAIQALNIFKKPLILIAGGSSKNLDLTEFCQRISTDTSGVILLKGTATEELKQVIIKFGAKKKILAEYDNLKQAVLKAQASAKPGYTVLFSPGCASFGMFKNEFDRGDQFNKIVNNL